MKPLLMCLFALSAFPLLAKSNLPEDKLDQEQIRLIQQRMEAAPSSTAIGGSRSGQLDYEKNLDERRDYETQKQKQLYENESYYRRGL